MRRDLGVIIPSRGRPEAVERVVRAWRDTGGFAAADMVWVVDADDPRHPEYAEAFRAVDLPAETERGPCRMITADQWRPLVPKLDLAAAMLAAEGYQSIGFAGDDHLPRTEAWSIIYARTLADMGVGVVYGNDLMQGRKLCTQWAMTASIVTALGRMVPAPAEHLYSDTSVHTLATRAGCIQYLHDVVIEHVHPFARKTSWDEGYLRVNRPEQYQRDKAAYRAWLADGCERDVAAVKALMSETS